MGFFSKPSSSLPATADEVAAAAIESLAERPADWRIEKYVGAGQVLVHRNSGLELDPAGRLCHSLATVDKSEALRAAFWSHPDIARLRRQTEEEQAQLYGRMVATLRRA